MKVTKFFNELYRPAHHQVIKSLPAFIHNNLWVVGFWLGSYLLTQTMNQMATLAPNQGPNIILILSVVLVELIVSYFIYLFAPLRFKQLLQSSALTPLGQINKMHAKDLISEQLRVASGIVIGLVLGIVPGIVRMLKWAFVPFIVTTHPDYQKGEVDALKYSEQLTLGLVVSIAIFWTVLTLFDLLFYYLEQSNFLGDADLSIWAWQGVVSLISFVVQLYAVLLTFVLYENVRSGEGALK